MHLAVFARKYPNAQLMYGACDMILRTQSNAFYHCLIRTCESKRLNQKLTYQYQIASVQYNRYHVVIYERSMVRRGKWKKGTVATDRWIVLWLVY